MQVGHKDQHGNTALHLAVILGRNVHQSTVHPMFRHHSYLYVVFFTLSVRMPVSVRPLELASWHLEKKEKQQQGLLFASYTTFT